MLNINKENFSLLLIYMQWLRGKILSALWRAIMNRTMIMCKYKFDSSKKKQMHEFPKDKGTVISIFSGNKSSSCGSARLFLVREVTSEVWRRDEQLHDCRAELGLQDATIEKMNHDFQGTSENQKIFIKTILAGNLLCIYNCICQWHETENSVSTQRKSEQAEEIDLEPEQLTIITKRSGTCDKLEATRL